MKVNVFLLYTIIVAILLFVCIEMSYMGAYSETQKFKLYKNQELDFNILYPSDWKIVEFSDDITDEGLQIISSFISPLDNSNDGFQEFFTIKTKSINDTDNKDLVLWDYFNDYFYKIQESKSIGSSEVNLYTNSSIKTLDYTFIPQPGLILNKKEAIFLKNDRIFHIEFTLTSDTANSFTPMIKGILYSFK
ncbi:MAG: hypothetical protein WCB31_01130 [Nitrososphaeraceae archaeon]